MSVGNFSFLGKHANKQSGEMLEITRICNKSQPKFKKLVQVDHVDHNALGNINCNIDPTTTCEDPSLAHDTFVLSRID